VRRTLCYIEVQWGHFTEIGGHLGGCHQSSSCIFQLPAVGIYELILTEIIPVYFSYINVYLVKAASKEK